MLEQDIQIEKYENLKKKFKSNLKIRKLDSGYKIITFLKDEIINEEDEKFAPYNSILFNNDNKLISLFPKIDIHEMLFLLEKNFKGFIIKSGIPFSLFWDKSIGAFGSWEIHSQSNIGEGGSFKNLNIKNSFNKFTKNNPNIYNILNKNYIYHLKLDDKEFKTIQILFAFEIKNEKEKDIIKCIDLSSKSFIIDHLGNKNLIIPNFLEYNECIELINRYGYLINSPHEQGLQLISANGNICKIINKTYFYKSIINSIYPQNFYMFLHLKSLNKITWATHDNKFLKEINKHLYNLYDLFSSSILELYYNIYILKERKLDSVNEFYQFILKEVHEVYLSNIKNQKKIRNSDIKTIINKKSIEEQMYLICSILK